MTKFQVTVTIEAPSIQQAINRVLYPEGEELAGVIEVTAAEAPAASR